MASDPTKVNKIKDRGRQKMVTNVAIRPFNILGHKKARRRNIVLQVISAKKLIIRIHRTR